MKKLLSAISIVLTLAACTKHDPFDNFEDGDLWILSRFLPENYHSGDNAFFSYGDLKNASLLENPILENGNYSRVPTSGELQMIFPKCDDPAFLGQYNMWLPLNHAWSPTSEGIKFIESAFLDNKDDYSADSSGEVIHGESEFYYASDYEDGNPDVIPNFALRFKGTSQYAAYMYQIKVNEFDTHTEYVLNLKAKWLKKSDVTTIIEDIIKPDYWKSGYLELEFPLESYLSSDGVMPDICGRLVSSTQEQGRPVLGSFSLSQSGMDTGDASEKYNLRMIRCQKNGKL